jgi:hypothetical protein
VGIVGGQYYAYFYFDPDDNGPGGSGTITFTPPAGSGVPVLNGQPYLQTIPLTVSATEVRFSNTSLAIGRDLQEGNYLVLDGPAPGGGLSLRISSSSSSVLLSASPTAAGTQQLDLTIPEGWINSEQFFVQNLGQSSGSAQLTLEVLTDPNPGYAPGPPATVTLRQSGFELICAGTGCGFSGSNYTLDTSTLAAPTLLYVQGWVLDGDTNYNRINTQSVRGGFTVTLPLSALGSLGGYLESDTSGVPGGVITQVSIAGGTSYAYFYFDPNDAGSGGSGNISFTPPAGAGVPLVGGQPYAQTIPLTVTATQVKFASPEIGVGRNLQQANVVFIDGPARAGGLTVRVSSSSGNVLLSESPTTVGTQQLDLTIPEGSVASGTFYVQNVGQSSGAAELTVEVLTDPNPGYVAGDPATVTLLGSGFELYCYGTGCGFGGSNYTLTTTTQAASTSLYVYSYALSEDLANNLFQNQPVRGGYTATLSLSSLASLGVYRSQLTGGPDTVITEVAIDGGSASSVFYFDPEDTGSGGSGTITFTPPAGSGVPVSGGLPYLQEIPLTVTP